MDPDAIRSAERVPHGGEPDQSVLDFSANTNPRTPEGVADVYADAFEMSRRYPDDEYTHYRQAAADYVDCRPDDVIPTPGGLAAIRLALEMCLEPGDEVLVPSPSFGEYAREVRLQGAIPRFHRHDKVLDVAPESYAAAIVCTPNNPTGETADPDRLVAFAERCHATGTVLLVDEAFLGFTESPSLAGQPGVVVARSLTKLFGLPGLRAGFAVATGEQHDALAVSRRAWNLGTPAAQVGAYCMRQDAFIQETRRRVRAERERMANRLGAAGFDVHPSDAPFLLCTVDGDVETLLARTRKQGIALRDARTFRGLDSHVRIAVKDRSANDRLLEVLADD